MEFYRNVFNGEVKEIISFEDAKTMCNLPEIPAEQMNQIACCKIAIQEDYEFHIAYQMPGEQIAVGNNMMVVICEKNEARVRQLYQALSEGGEILVPLAPVFWSIN